MSVCTCNGSGRWCAIHAADKQRLVGGGRTAHAYKAKVERLEAEVERLAKALRFYADEQSWLNHREIRGVPGFHGRAIAQQALDAREVDRAA